MADFDKWDIAGYGGGDEWYDVENGAPQLEEGDSLAGIEEIVVHFYDPETDDHAYATIWGPWDDWDTLYDLIDDIDPDLYSGE